MAITAFGGRSVTARPKTTGRRFGLKHETRTAWLFLLPSLIGFVVFYAYPALRGFYLSFTDYNLLSQEGHWIGLQNYKGMLQDALFWNALGITFKYVIINIAIQTALALAIAVLMHRLTQSVVVRSVVLLPWLVPNAVLALLWMWMLDPAFSIVNRLLIGLGVPKPGPSWLGNPYLAMFSIIMINTWRGLPFYGITLLAGLQTVPPELYEAATIDGASGWQRFRYVTLPLLKPIIMIVTLFSVIFTFADFQLVYVLTHGGPQNATQLFATYAFDIGMGAGQLGLGASVALTMLPALGLLIIALTLYMRRQ